MTDIATRYMKLVEKRPELQVVDDCYGIELSVYTDSENVVQAWYWPQSDCSSEERLTAQAAHALIFAKLVEALPKDHGVWPLTLEAILAFWEGQA